MSTRTEIEQNAAVYCADGPFGAVRQVVVDRAVGDITDLIVECDDGERLVVPVTLVARADGHTVTLVVARGDLLSDATGVAPYHPEEFHAYGPRVGQVQQLESPGLPTTSLPTTPPRVAAPAAGPPPDEPVDTTDPARLGPFVAGILRVPVRGEELVAERRAFIATEVIVRRERRYLTVDVRETVHKERVEVREKGA